MKKQPIILGGGLAGLSACYHGDGVIYEKMNRVGGMAISHKDQGFVFDEGIHVMHTKNEYILNLMDELEVNMDVRDRSAWIFSHEAMTRYPFQANTYGLPIDIVRDCLLGFIENDFTSNDKIKNYEDWIYYMFGDGIAKHFMIPYSQKFWGVDAKDLTTEWVNVRHPKPSMDEVVTGALKDQTKEFGVNAVYRYPKKEGFGYIGERLAAKCKNRIKVGMEATNIDVKNKKVEFNNETVISYDTLLSSLPLPELIKIISDVPSDVVEAANKLKTNSMFIVNIGVNRQNISDKNWIYYLDKKYSFIRVSFPSNQSDYVARAGTSTVMAEVAYGHDNPLPTTRDKMSNRVIDDLISADILNKSDDIVYLDTIDIKYAYVIFDEVRKTSISKIHDYLKEKDIIPFGRYGLWDYLWSDEAILGGKKIAEDLSTL